MKPEEKETKSRTEKWKRKIRDGEQDRGVERQ